jgi:hypothetical protein
MRCTFVGQLVIAHFVSQATLVEYCTHAVLYRAPLEHCPAHVENGTWDVHFWSTVLHTLRMGPVLCTCGALYCARRELDLRYREGVVEAEVFGRYL